MDDFRTVQRVAGNDANTWLLGEITKETACSSSLGQFQCQTTSRTYNTRGEVDTENRGDPGDPETTRNTTFTRDSFGNLTLVTANDAFGNHRSACITYEKEGIFPYAFSRAVGQVSRVAFDAGLGVPTALKDTNGLTTTWQHDAFGRTTRETGPDDVVADLGVQRLKTGGPSHAWYALYTDTRIGGFIRSQEELDSRGRTVRSWGPGPHVAAKNDGSQAPPFALSIYEVDTAYDLLGRVAQRSRPWLVLDPASPHLTTQYQYDTRGRALSVTSPWGYKTTYDYSGNTVVATMPAVGAMLATSSTTEVDPLGRTIKVTDGKGGNTLTTYGPFGAPRAVESPAGLFVTVRDAYGRARTEVDPDRGTTTIDYNGFDEQSQIVDAANRKVAYVYDSLGRRTARLDNGVLSTKWHYDDPLTGYGRLADVKRFGGATRSYTYDPKGRVSSIDLLLNGETFTSTYAYNNATGNLDTTAYPQGPGGAPFRIKNEYDEYDNLIGVRDDILANHPYYWRLTGVNGVGQTSQEIFGNNDVAQGHALVTERDYFTGTGALKAIRTKAGATKVQDLGYRYDARLNLTARGDGLQLVGNAPVSERFSYDELDRLTSTTIDVLCLSGGSCAVGQTMTYGADGNITTKSDVAGGAQYVYDGLNGHPHAVASIGGLAYGHDTVGNQTSRPGLTIDYTPFDLPKKYTPTSGNPTPTTFDYDGEETRVRKTTPTDATVYAGDYERVTHFGPSADATEHRYYIRSNERVIAMVKRTSAGTKTAYLHADHLGSTDVITSGINGSLGTVLERRSYDAFGAKRDPVWGVVGAGSTNVKMAVGFTGQESENEAGLVNMKGRMYDPKVGRFLSTDPLVSHPSFSQSWNPYSYVLNNPLKYVDPSGFEGYATTTPDDSSHTGVTYVLPGDIDVVNPTPGFQGNAKLVDQINHDVPPALQGDADLPAGDPLSPPAEPLKDKASVQEAGGFLSGIALGYVPGASLAAQAAINAGLISEGTRFARIGRGAGEMVGGFAAVLTGGGGLVAGGGASGTGVGALVGVPVLVGSAVLAVGGVANVAVGGRGMMAALMSKGSGGKPPNMSPKDAARAGAFNEAKRASGIPTSQQPSGVRPNMDRRGNPQSGRVYVFEVLKSGGETRTVLIREDAGGHDYGPEDSQNRGPHFNDEAGNHYDY